jgi:hypothetical protein
MDDCWWIPISCDFGFDAKGLAYPSWFGGNVRGGDGKPSPYCQRPCGHRGQRERDLYPRGSAGPALRPCGFSSGAGSSPTFAVGSDFHLTFGFPAG